MKRNQITVNLHTLSMGITITWNRKVRKWSQFSLRAYFPKKQKLQRNRMIIKSLVEEAFLKLKKNPKCTLMSQAILIKSQQYCCLIMSWTKMMPIEEQTWIEESSWGLNPMAKNHRKLRSAERRSLPQGGTQWWIIQYQSLNS